VRICSVVDGEDANDSKARQNKVGRP
jgi:hypothetical protein